MYILGQPNKILKSEQHRIHTNKLLLFLFQKFIPSTTNPRIREHETGFFISVFLLEVADGTGDGFSIVGLLEECRPSVARANLCGHCFAASIMPV